MTKQVQRRRGTNTQHTGFTGAEGEISVNTTNKSIHVHDGTTAGGFEGARADLNNVTTSDITSGISGGTVASLTVTSADINGGSIDGTTIGASTAAAGTFTTFTSTGIDDNASSTAITIDSSQNVGINRTSPNGLLHMQSASGTDSAFYMQTSADTDDSVIYFGDNASSTIGGIRYDHTNNDLIFRTNSGDRVYIDDSGNVGIGTTSPTLSTSWNRVLNVHSGSGSGGSIRLSDSTTGNGAADGLLVGTFGVNAYILNYEAGDIIFQTSASERMRIDESGDVGIGVSDPAGYRLHISDASPSVRISGTSETAGQTANLIFGTSTYNRATIQSTNVGTAGADIGFLTAPTGGTPVERMSITSAGELQLTGNGVLKNQESGGNFSYLQQTSSDARLYVQYSQPLLFGTNNTERMRIDSSGNVGIGETSPSLGSGSTGLHITGTQHARLKLESGADDESGIQFTENGTDQWRIAYDAASNHLEFTESGVADRMVIQDGGNVGMGTTAPTHALQIARSGSDAACMVESYNATPGSYNTSTFRLESKSASSATYDYSFAASGSTANITRESVNHITLSGGQTVFNEDGGNLDFRVEGDTNTHLIFADASADNVGIGTSSPSGGVQLDVRGTGVLQLVNTDTVQLLASNGGSTLKNVSNNPLLFGTNNTESMRLNAGGDLLINTTSQIGSGNPRVSVDNGSDGVCIATERSGTSSVAHFQFINGNGTVGSITTSGSNTAFNTSSDYRLKENVTAITGATERLKQLNPVRFNFIADANTTVDGFLAHEVSDHVPEAVTGEKDAVDADGNPEYQGIDQSKLVPLLVATIKELEARITALES